MLTLFAQSEPPKPWDGLGWAWLEQPRRLYEQGWPAAVLAGLVVAGLLLGLALWWLRRQETAPLDEMPAKLLPSPAHPAALLLRPVLRGIGGEFHGSSIDLTEEPVLIGRDPKICHLVYPAQFQSISKRHCIVRYHAKSQCFLLVDCHSANGTFIVNGARLPSGGSELLNAGQRFYLADAIHTFEVNFEALP